MAQGDYQYDGGYDNSYNDGGYTDGSAGQSADTTQYWPGGYHQQNSYQQTGYQQTTGYQQPPYQQYQQSASQSQYPMVPQQKPADVPTSTGMWVLWLFLMTIPVVNIVLLFVFAFSNSDETSRKNWARAQLIWILVGIVIAILAFVVFGVSLSSIENYIESQTVSATVSA